MHAARHAGSVIVTALAAGTAGALGASTAEASVAAARQAGIVQAAATSRAPLVVAADLGLRSKRGMAAPAMSPEMRRANKIKQAAARRYLRHAHAPGARDLAATQRAQIRNYFCGPATVSEMLAQMHIVLHQKAAARELGTNRSGTDWSNSRGYPVPRVLNAHQKRTRYVAVGLPWAPTAAQVATFRMDLLHDVSRGRGVPIAGAGYEVPGGPHLVGHPAGQTILHWFDIRGYARHGAVTDYMDSVHGAPSIGWAAGVPAYSSLPTVTMVYILGARGYVW
jgi:hypothetical protein